MNLDDKLINPNFVHRFSRGIRDKFRSSVKQKPGPSQKKTHALTSSTVASKKQDEIDRNDTTANEVRPRRLKAKLDLWQEALDKAQQSTDWKSHKEQYDEALLECQGNNQNILNKSGAENKKSTSLVDAISEHLISLQEKVLEKQWEYKRSSGDESFYFRDVINRIVQWVKVFEDPGNQLAALDPTKAAALVWGFVQFFVERAVVCNEIRDMAIDQEPIANLITRYALIENLYLNSTSGTSDEIDEAIKCKIVSLYTAVILYQMAIYNFWKQGKITHGIQSLVPNKLKEMSSLIQRKSAEVDKTLLSSDRKVLQRLLKDINLKIQKPITEIGTQVQQVLHVAMNMDNDRYSKVLNWVSPILHMDHHQEYKPLGGTGEWIFDHSDWNKWRQSQDSGLFWLRGKMGAGKSNLVFSIISHLLKICKNDQERTAFFYINNTRRAEHTKSAETILRSLLKQLTIRNNKFLLQPVVTKYDVLRNDSSLRKEDCITLLADIISEFRQTNIIIDGLDELEDDDVRKDLLVSLKQIINGLQGAVVKIFISSRDHVNIHDILHKTFPRRIEIIVADNNYEDIRKFITSRVQDVEETLSEPIPEDIKRDMKSILEKRSDGMFLWVDLSMKYLIRIKAKRPAMFVKDLETVPSDLKEAYEKLYKSLLQGQNSERVAIIQKVFCFLLYGYDDKVFEASAFLSAINYKTTLELSAKEILDLCSTFIELDPETRNFRIIHFSVKEFLQTLAEYDFQDANAMIAAHCVSYLNHQNLPDYRRVPSGVHLERSDRIYHFGYYAHKSWIIHCSRAGNLRQQSPLVEMLSEFWSSGTHGQTYPFERWVYSMRYSTDYPDRDLRDIVGGGFDSLVVSSRTTGFFLACQYDLRETVESYLCKGWDINLTVPYFGPGLSYACIGNHIELVSYLLSHGAKILSAEFEEFEDSPLFAAIRAQRPDILRLFLQNTTLPSINPLLEVALGRWNGEWDIFYKLDSQANYQVVNVLLEHSSDFQYSREVQLFMFQGGPRILKLLLERNPSLSVTTNTLNGLFSCSTRSLSDTRSYLELLLPLNPELVKTRSFLIALERYGGEKPSELAQYIIEDLNSSDSSFLISELALRSAIKNLTHTAPFMKFLLRKSPALKISDETMLCAIVSLSRDNDDAIETLFRHYPTIRNFSILDFEKTFKRPEYIFASYFFSSVIASTFMAIVLRYCPKVIIDQELFTEAMGAPRASLSALKILLSRNPKIKLTWQMVGNINSHAANQVVGEMICSSDPEQITDKILGAALGNSFLRHGDQIPPIIVNLLSKAVESLELSEDTVFQACKSRAWIMEQVLGRWPNAPLSKYDLVTALCDKQKFQILMEKRPSIEISAEVIKILYEQNRDSDTVSTITKVLELQPNTIITEELLESVSFKHSSIDEELHRRLFDILLRRIPHAKLTHKAIQCSMVNGSSFAQLTFEARPDLELSTYDFGTICLEFSDEDPGDQMIVHQLLKRLSSSGLDEDGMMEFMTACTPKAVMTVLSNKPDAISTERVINSLLNNFSSRRLEIIKSWSRNPGDEAFNMLLDRSGLSESSRQSLLSEFQELKRKHKGADGKSY